MNLLIIGGGVFLGQGLLQAALEAGHAVTVFNRGHSRNWWPPGVKWIVGDRKEDVHLLMGRRWDAVIDTCGYRPQDVGDHLRRALRQLRSLRLRLQRFRVCLVRAHADPRGGPPRLRGGLRHRDSQRHELRSAQGGMRADDGPHLRQPRRRGATRADRRPDRSHGALLVLGVAAGRRWARAGAGLAPQPGAVHRRARPLSVDPAPHPGGGDGRDSTGRDRTRARPSANCSTPAAGSAAKRRRSNGSTSGFWCAKACSRGPNCRCGFPSHDARRAGFTTSTPGAPRRPA